MKIVSSLIGVILFAILFIVILYFWNYVKIYREGFVEDGRGMDIEVDYSQSDVDYSNYPD